MLASSITFAVALAAQTPASNCDAARGHYEALAFDQALATVKAERPSSPGCLEVEALVLLALGRRSEAEARLRTLFGQWPDHTVDRRALAPAERGFIDRIRTEARPLTVKLQVDWIGHDAVRATFVLQGGLRGGRQLRYETIAGLTPVAGTVRIVGRSATVTIEFPPGVQPAQLRVRVTVVDDVGRAVHGESLVATLPVRPAAPAGAPMAPAPADDGGWPWWVWAIGAAVVAGAAVTTVVLVQPDRPDASGTLGGIEIP